MRLYRRHGTKCRFYGTDDASSKTNCKCPIHADDGTRRKGSRTAIGTRDWARAESRLRKMEEAQVDKKIIATVDQACKAFLADCQRRKLRPSTIRSYEKTLTHLKEFCDRRDLRLVAEINQGVLLEFQNGREKPPKTEGDRPGFLEASTTRKELQTLRGFFRFLVDQDNVSENYAKRLRPPKETRRPTLPFTQADIDSLVAASLSFEDDNPNNRERTKQRSIAVLMTMLYSGLRISDVATLERKRVDLKDGRLLLRMEKTGEPVYVKLAKPAVQALTTLPKEGPCFFWSGQSAPATAIGNMRRTIDRLCKKAGIEGHPHRFRDTFAVRMLEKGVPIDQVSILLGHTSVKTTEKYYAPWVRARQRLLDDAVATLDFVDRVTKKRNLKLVV